MYSPYSIGSSNIFGNSNILIDQQTTKAIIEKYKARPRSFSEKQVGIIKRHAQHYRIPFAEDEQTWMDHVGGVVKQAVQGYISGFTTINIGEAPQTPAESISRAVGSFAGFAGLTPAAPLKMLGAATKSQSLVNVGKAMAGVRGNSVPLYIANKIMKKGTAIFDAAVAKQSIDGTGAVASAIKFLKNPQASDYISRGLRMGLAGGISSWQGGIDQMMKSFVWGASAGTVDATIANAIRLDHKVSEGVIKGLAGALADGLPATLRGDTTPEQVYYYLRGAYFGATEVPWSKRYANEKILEYKKGGVDRDTFIKGLPKAVRKDFIEGISRVELTAMTEAGLREAGLLGKFNEQHKRYVEAEVAKYISDTDDNKATSDNGGDPGQGPIALHIPPTVRIKNIVESFPDFWRTEGGDNVEAKRSFTDDIMVKHQKTIDEFKSEYNTDPNYYHDKMIEELRSAGYMGDKVPEQASLELHAIARDAEKTKYSKYFVPTIDFEKGTFEISMSDAIHNRAPNNKILGERYHSNLLDDIIGEFSGGRDTVIRLPNIYVQGTRGYEEVPVSSAKNPDSRKIAFNSNLRDEHKTKLVETANNMDREIYNKYGYVYFGGNNAKIDALYVPLHPEIAAIRNNSQAIDTAFNTLMTNMFESKTMRNASGEEFKSVDDLKKYVLDGLSKSNVMGLDLEKAIYTSHALYEMRMQFGGTKLADTADYYKNFFDDAKLPKDVKAMTKRMQLVMAAGTPLREPYFRDVDRTKLNPLFNDLKTPRILLVKDADLTDADFRIGVDLPGSAERSTDGAVFVLPELMRVEGEYTGLGKEVGAIKSVSVAATGSGGTILAKHAEHVAPPALAKIMRENGVTHVMMGTAGKVTGSYNQRMITIDELMAAKFENLQSKVISETRWEDWKVNTGKAITPQKAHKAKFRVPIQSLSMLNGRYGALDGDEVDTVRQIFVDEVIRKNFYGEQASNDKVTEFLNADGETALKLRQEILNDEILDGIGRQNIMKLILDDRDVSIADKLITRIINENMDSINEKYQDGEMSSMEYESAMREASADSGILSKALYASESATALLYNRQTSGILDKVINNYIVGAAIRPKISNGMELPIAPYFAKAWGNDPVMKLLNVPVDPTGTIKDDNGNPVQKVYKFALGNSERYKKITRADGKKELLGDIYDRVMQRRKDPEYLSRLSEVEKEQALEDVELLRWVIIRTPHSHPSSTIVAELAGFDGMDGPRIYLDQAAMGRLGGADVDIDTVKIFTGSKISTDGKFHGMPSRLKDAFNQFEHLAYKIEDDNGRITQQPVQQIKKVTVRDYDRYDDTQLSQLDDSQVYVLRKGNSIEQYGNPFSGSGRGGGLTIKMRSVKDAVDAYIKWLNDPNAEFTDNDGKIHKNVKQEQRNWILKQIDSGALDGKILAYYKSPGVEGGKYYSHADALADFINQRRRGATTTTPQQGIKFTKSIGGYGMRTDENAANADATIAFALDFTTYGEVRTKKAAAKAGKQYIAIDLNNIDYNKMANDIIKQLKVSGSKSVNIAGNGIYSFKNMSQAKVDNIIYNILSRVHSQYPLTAIRSGGQTGVDEAGAKAGVALGIPTTVHAPRNWEMRYDGRTDITKEDQFKARFSTPQPAQQVKFSWARTAPNNYEISSQGDKTYSALYAKLKDGRTIEEAYQQAKGSGKGKPAVDKNFDYWGTYLGLWKQWAKENPDKIEELRVKAAGKTLTDKFAKTDNSQARALAEILNETAPKQQLAHPKQQLAQEPVIGTKVSLIEAKSDVDDMGNRISTQYERFAQVENDPLYSPAMMYARGTRQQIQQMFVTGRNDLGEIANAGGSHMSEAVSFLKQQPNETYKTTINYNGKKATIVYKLRDDMMGLALKKYNTALNMAADVTDFNGLKDPADIKYDIFNHAFDIKVTIDGKPASERDRKTIVLTRGLMKKIASAKQVMYSRNYRANRRFTADEIYSILKDAEDIYGGRTDTLIGAARQAILDADMSIPLITKDNADVVRKVYDRYKELILTQRYAHKMARPSSAVVQTEDVKLFFQNRMWDPAYREQVIDTYSQKAWTNKTVEIVLRQNGVVRRTKSVNGDTYKSSYVLTVEGNLQKMIASANRKKNKTAEKEIGTVLGKYINKKNGRKVTFTDADKRILDSAETMMRRDLADIDKLGLQKDRLWRTRFMQEQYRRSERYIANDLYDMVSTMMEHKYINQIPEDLQSQIPHKIGRSIHMLHQKMDEIRNLPGVQRVGEHSIDELHNELRKGLSPEEQKLFDTELFSSMLWGGKGQQDGSKRGVSKSEVTNLAYSLANPPNDTIREYNENILGVLKGKKDIVEVGYEKSPLAKNDGTAEDIMMQVLKNPDMLRTPGGIIDTTGWNNMMAMDLVNKVIPYEMEGDPKSAVLKDPILKKIYYKEMLPEMQELKKHFVDRNITDANDILNLVRGMTGKNVDQGRVGKDPTALTLEEVKMLNRAFRYIEEPQILVKIFGSKSINYPVIRKLYYYLIPSEIGRDIQRFVWDTKKTQGFWANKYGQAFLGSVEVPTNIIESISEYINMAQSLATKTREDMVRKVGNDMKRYMDHPMFPELFDIAVIKREHTSLVEAIKGQVDMPQDTKLRHLEELDSLYRTANRKLRDIQKLHPDMQVKFSGADGSDVIVNLSPKQIIDNINEVITRNLSDVYDNVISAKMENVNKYAKRFTDGPQKGKIIYIRNPKTNKLTTIPVIDKRAFFADMENAIIEKGGWDRDLGIDGVRMIAHSILYQSQYGGLMNKINVDEADSFLKLADNNAMTTLKWTQEGYFPHMHSDRARFAKDINDYIKDVENDKSMSSDAKKKNIEKYVRNYVRNGANINSEVDVDYLHRYGDIIDSEMKRQDRINKSSDSKLKYLNGISRSGNQMHREYFSLGYSRNINSLYEYMGNMSAVYYRNISQILSRIKIADFTNELAKQYDKKTANNLRNFMHLYAQGAAGYGVTIPEFLVENPDMKIKGTLYHMYSDSVITDKINKISAKLGIKGGMAGKFSQHDLAAWSALEAKYSLATLLSRPKSMSGNMIGGTLNTAISTGFGPLLRAQTLGELRKAHPEFTTLEDWHKWAVQKGVVEDMFLNELEGGRYAGHTGMKNAIAQVVKKLAHDPNMDDKTLLQIVKQSGVSEEMFKKAGWFMRTAERKLRLDAFFAHYLQQFDNLSPYVGGNDAHSSLKFDSPILIEMAKKGIKATQFLYSAPFRPMFSSSSLGKIMTRFHMYAYNSLDFRKNILNMAGVYGFQEGTNEFERMKRLVIADMVSLAAANAFMYSVFDNNLPAPWTWLQDMANWLFGNERERDRAFYGSYPSAIAPLQIVTPPSMRMVGPVIKGMIENDFSKISGYTIWTMFPFGPLGMDVKRSLENPMQIMDTMLGLPLRGVANVAKTGVNSKTGETWTKTKKEEPEPEKEKPKKRQINNAFMQMVPVY